MLLKLCSNVQKVHFWSGNHDSVQSELIGSSALWRNGVHRTNVPGHRTTHRSVCAGNTRRRTKHSPQGLFFTRLAPNFILHRFKNYFLSAYSTPAPCHMPKPEVRAGPSVAWRSHYGIQRGGTASHGTVRQEGRKQTKRRKGLPEKAVVDLGPE